MIEQQTNSPPDQQLQNLSLNLCLCYARLTDDIHQQLMEKAIADSQHKLRLSYSLILPQISRQGSRIVDLAKSHGVSKQAIGQLAKELEKEGLIYRIQDEQDKRSRKLQLSDKGIDLIRLCTKYLSEVDARLEQQLGSDDFKQLKSHSIKIFTQLKLSYPPAGTYTPNITGKSIQQLPIIVFVGAIANYLDLLLQQKNAARGHPALKRSYWQVLEKANQQGMRINEIANLNRISKQAVSQLVKEIEKSGYIQRISDSKDKRAKKLLLTDNGEQLVRDTLQSTEEIETQVADIIGRNGLIELKRLLGNYLINSGAEKSLSRQTNNASSTLRQLYKSCSALQRQQWFNTHNNEVQLSQQGLQMLTNTCFKLEN